MQRLLTSLTLVGLLVATAAAFAVTERLKLTKSALMPGTRVSKAFSPLCGCARSHANIKVVVRRADTVTVRILDSHSHEVDFLTTTTLRRGEARFRWDGTTNAGLRAPDGVYRVSVHLARQHQTIVLPNDIQLDTKAPDVISATPSREDFSPDGDKQADFVRLTYTLSKPAHLLLYLGGRRILETYRHPASGAASWKGIARGRLLRPGRYTLEVGAIDAAGNRTPPDQRARVHVRLRYIVLASTHIVARAGRFFDIGVSTDAVRYHWALGTRRGRNGGAVLRLRAPKKAGRYVLTVSERGHIDRARLVVRK